MGKKTSGSGRHRTSSIHKKHYTHYHHQPFKLGNTSSSCYRQTYKKIKKAIKEAKEKEKTITCSEILKILNCFPNFLGCFSQDSIDSLFLQSVPCLFLVNVDSHQEPGSHWMVVGLFEKTIEIFDPLGFKFYNWKSVPCQLLKFIHTESLARKLLIAPQVQPLSSSLCAFYCIYFVFHRYKLSFRQVLSRFSLPNKNDRLLLNF